MVRQDSNLEAAKATRNAISTSGVPRNRTLKGRVISLISGDLFLKQPDLNWANSAVREAVHDLVRFWLDRGCVREPATGGGSGSIVPSRFR
ncbi:hypothetical protein IW261DRAFT_96728 [Armillaria novae-zelandiae]|uniref:Uncharacterized protein n=1 Tax=Armillaria novae-zelandiae TaxID=153914 RepID=A0AA39PYQ2_9AGAR|nr:hypothetical protein IW261DRAFT_96728 [Armillaria novae-zelandiae]